MEFHGVIYGVRQVIKVIVGLLKRLIWQTILEKIGIGPKPIALKVAAFSLQAGIDK